MSDDLTTMTAAELTARAEAISAEQERRRTAAAFIEQQQRAGEALRALAATLPEVTVTTATVTPEQGWLPGQIVTQGGKRWRQTLTTPTTLTPGGTLRPWEAVEEPEAETEAETEAVE